MWTYGFLYDHGLKWTPLKVVTIMDAFTRVVLAIYRRQYNTERPHRPLNYRTLAEFTCEWLERQL